MDEQPPTSTNHCPAPAVLQRFLLGRLAPSEVDRLAGHVEQCPACVATLRTFRDRDTLLDAMEHPVPAPEQAVEDKVLAGLLSRLEQLDTAVLAATPLPPGRLPEVPGYEILEELGRGSMGVVYKARHLSLNRVVALKMIRSGQLAGPEERLRFLAEAEAIAAVRHPGIVQVHDFGTHDGLPYFSLEFCPGGTLADKLAGPPLPPREAAGVVEQVACAVQAAHERGIVHRDLKPGNVLLDRDGSPRVTDFGLAKRVQAVGLTATGAVMGTPSYMAPEQVAGKTKETGPAADVYALGAILYECLTGRPPFNAAGVHETLLQVLSDEPVPPRRLNAQVPHDLETICLKCLQKEPARRYSSAAELAGELGRWQRGEPIRARPAGRVERALKWARRRPAAAALVGVSVLALVGLIALSSVALWQWQAAVAALDSERTALTQAEDNLKLARQAVDGTFNVARDDPLFQQPRMEKAKKLLLEKALPFYKSFRERQHDDRNLRWEEATQWSRVGYIEELLGRTAQAHHAYQQAHTLFAQLARAHPDVPDYRNSLASTHNSLGDQLERLGRRQEALAQYQQARDLLRKLVQTHPRVPEYQKHLATAHTNLGLLLSALGNTEEALREHEQARDLRGQLVETHPNEYLYRDDLASTCTYLGNLLSERGRSAEALKQHRRALSLRRALLKAHPDEPDYQNNLARTHLNLGRLLSALGQRALALAELQQARDLRRALVKTHPDRPQYQKGLATTHTNLGDLLRNLGKRDAALKEHQQARDLLVALVKAHPERPEYQDALASACINLGIVLNDLNRRPEARQAYQQAALLSARLVKDHPEVPDYQHTLVRAHNNLANLLSTLGKHPEAQKEHEQARDLQRKLVKAHPELPDYQHTLAGIHINLGLVLAQQGKQTQALAEYQQARDLLRKLVKVHPERVGDQLLLAATCRNKGDLLRDSGKIEQSLVPYAEAIALLEAILRRQPGNLQARSYLVNGYWGRAWVLALVGRHRQADADWDRAVELAPAEQRFDVCLGRSGSRARQGDYFRAASEAGDLGRTPSLTGRRLYALACIHALNAASAARDTSRPLAERERRTEEYARLATALLERAASAGFFRDPASRTHLERSSDLAALRDRDDFKRFRARLQPEDLRPAD
jgi:serine/threonine-protein kinase